MDEFKKRKDNMTLHEKVKDYLETREEITMRKKDVDEVTKLIYFAILILMMFWLLAIGVVINLLT